MTTLLVQQLRFARQKWEEALDGVTEEEGRKRFEPINSISWMVGHLAAHEQRYWLELPRGHTIVPEVHTCRSGQAASTPSLSEMWAAWQRITGASESYLTALTEVDLASRMSVDGQPHRETIGTMLLRTIYHYWYHIGESQAVRQLLGHTDLPGFVGAMPPEAQYSTEGPNGGPATP